MEEDENEEEEQEEEEGGGEEEEGEEEEEEEEEEEQQQQQQQQCQSIKNLINFEDHVLFNVEYASSKLQLNIRDLYRQNIS